MRFVVGLLALVLSASVLAFQAIGEVRVAALPPEARDTLARVRGSGPFPHDRDGVVVLNRERLLPPRPRGLYREYTVETPGGRNRGARRIVAAYAASGVLIPGALYYTDDHYRSFRRILE